MQVNFQDAFLAQLRKEGQTVTIYLTKGVQLKGVIRAFDSFTIFLEDGEGRVHMIYKHSVTTVSPTRPLAADVLASSVKAAAAG